MGRQEAAEVGEVMAADGSGERLRHARSAEVVFGKLETGGLGGKY